MSVFLTGPFATRIIRAARIGLCPPLQQIHDAISVPSSHTALSSKEYLLWLKTQLGCMENEKIALRVPSGAERTKPRSFSYRVTSEVLSPNLVSRIQPTTKPVAGMPSSTSEEILLDSPLLDLLRFADEVDTGVVAGSVERVEADILIIDRICEYCGTYALDPFQPNEREARYEIEPVLSLPTIKDFLAQPHLLSHKGGVRRLRICSKYAHDLLASPSETMLAMALTAMPRVGGFHIPGMLLNAPLDLTDDDAVSLYHQQLTPDFYFPNANMVVEVQGKIHEEAESVVEDQRREADYRTLGIDAIFSVAGEYATPSGATGLALEIASAIDRLSGNDNQVNRVRRLAKSSDFHARQRLLFETLFCKRQ